MNFGIRGPVVFAFGLANQHFALCIANLDCVLGLRVGSRKLVRPGALGSQSPFCREIPLRLPFRMETRSLRDSA